MPLPWLPEHWEWCDIFLRLLPVVPPSFRKPPPQLSYADMLKRVDPLRRELKQLEKLSTETRIKGEEIEKVIKELEESIARYKEEYAILISEANAIKNDLATVEAKVHCVYTYILTHLCRLQGGGALRNISEVITTH